MTNFIINSVPALPNFKKELTQKKNTAWRRRIIRNNEVSFICVGWAQNKKRKQGPVGFESNFRVLSSMRTKYLEYNKPEEESNAKLPTEDDGRKLEQKMKYHDQYGIVAEALVVQEEVAL